MKQFNEKINYILYARKSSEEDNRQMLSLDSQEGELKKIAERDNLEIIKIFREARSAKEPYNRPIFSEMVKMIEAGKANGILCWKLDRLSRNAVEEGIIKHLLQKNKIKIIRTPDRDYRPEDNALIASIEFGMANQYIRDLSVNVKRGLISKAESGLFPNFAPLGYLNNPLDPKGRKQIIKDPERFDLVRKMFDLVLSEYRTPVEVWRIAHNEWKMKNPKGKLISRSTTYRILTNTLYSGIFEFPVGSGNWHKGKHEAIITIEEYDKIQIILGKKGKPRPHNHIFAFTGLMKCGSCGATITAEQKIKRQKNGNIHQYTYYHCTKKLNPNCIEKYIEEKILIKQIVNKIDKISISPEFHVWGLDWLKKDIMKNVSLKNKIINSREKQIVEIEKQSSELLNLLLRKIISEEDYQNKKSELAKEKAKLEIAGNNNNDKIQLLFDKTAEYFDLAKDAKNEFLNGDINKRKCIVTKLGSNPSISERIFSICIKKALLPFENISKEVRGIYDRLEPAKITINSRELNKLYAKNLILRCLLDKVRNYFEQNPND
jgi:DNA invertase Pin-like site-specific DNA recombinase